ncbi:MAG: ATP-binding cassette domain-containing protein, partial [Myxococcota bacterium]
ELILAGAVLAVGAGGGWHVLVLLVAVAAALALGARLYRRSERWTHERLSLTDMTVERMVGHRTRLVQCRPERWHDGEDDALHRYLDRSLGRDRSQVALLVALPRAFMIAAVIVLAPAFIAGSGAAGLAVALGGILVARAALAQLAAGIHQLVGVAIAWRQVAPMFHAAAAPVHRSPADLATRTVADDDCPVVEASAVGFRYPGQSRPVLDQCDLTIAPGDRLLLCGPSGGGKSTLASVLLGTRAPDSGLLLVCGLDRPSLGEDGWRRAVAAAPQFHDNHVFSDTFAFNLLLGRSWPPRAEDTSEAQAICRELGLGPLLERMPGGMEQPVGETGWQLSHGERSRLFLARALLQDSQLVILDESFAALDPDNLERAMRCARARARTLLVIAHP